MHLKWNINRENLRKSTRYNVSLKLVKLATFILIFFFPVIVNAWHQSLEINLSKMVYCSFFCSQAINSKHLHFIIQKHLCTFYGYNVLLTEVFNANLHLLLIQINNILFSYLINKQFIFHSINYFYHLKKKSILYFFSNGICEPIFLKKKNNIFKYIYKCKTRYDV